MKTFIVTNKATGAEVYRYQAEAAIAWQGMEFATHDHTEEVAPEPTATLLHPRRLTRLGFIGLLTQDEFTGLLAAAKGSVAVEMFVKMLDWATPDADGTSIDRDDPRTIAGVRALFSPVRADEILGVAR